jgi:DNA-binding response OmpR family regulator
MKRYILVLDDDTDILNLVKMILSQIGYNVLTSSTFDDFYELLNEEVGLILLDDVMPVKTGIEICRDLKQKSETSDIPVIIFSASGAGEKKDAAYKAGAEEFLLKPFSIDQITRVVDKHYPLN